MRFGLSILFLSLALSTRAATYYIATTGSDSNPGTSGQPWRTFGKATTTLVAGDTVLINNGNYAEQVQESTSGTAGNPITYRAINPRLVSLTAFRITGAYVVLDGLRFTGYSGVGNTWGAATRIDNTGSSCIITNCVYSDTPYVIASDFSFSNVGGNKVTSPSSDFNAAGFGPGSQVYLGASGLTGQWYTNHDTTWIVSSNTATSLWLTNSSANTFASDPGANYWAIIRPGSSTAGFRAIDMILSGGAGPTNCLISGNLITNWCGNAMNIVGRDTTIENNYITKLLSFRWLDYAGTNVLIRSNILKDSPNILHFTTEETGQLTHPEGGGWFDYQVAMISDPAATDSQNITFEHNWFENLENNLGGAGDRGSASSGLNFLNNVFVGVSGSFSGGRDNMHWISNTFFRCTFDGAAPLQLGSSPPAQSGYVLTNNLFIDCGSYFSMSGKGWYTITTNAPGAITNFNMVASPEMTGYAAKTGFAEVNGINGGDPVFLNTMNLMGPDGIPFTADDGLKILPNSPFASLGGALGTFAPTSGIPTAHFRVGSPNGWYELTGTNYNPYWVALRPYEREGPIRPYTTPSLLGPAPIVFDASRSMSGVGGSTTNTAISQYIWTVDGVSVTNSSPSFSYTPISGGDKLVTLTVKNTSGNTHSISNFYTVGEHFFYVDKVNGGSDSNPGTSDLPWLTIQHAHDVAGSGDVVVVRPGIFDERVTVTRPGIHFLADGTVTNRSSFRIQSADNTRVDGFHLTADGAFAVLKTAVWFNSTAATNCWIVNNKIHDTLTAFSSGLIHWDVNDATSAVNQCVISNNMFWNIGGAAVSVRGRTNYITDNWISNNFGSDLFNVGGAEHRFQRNYATKLGWDIVTIRGCGNSAFDGPYYDDFTRRIATNYTIWTNAAGWNIVKSESYASHGWSNQVNVVNGAHTVVYASAPSFDGTWTMHNGTIVSAPTFGIGAITHADYVEAIGPIVSGVTTPNRHASNIVFESNIILISALGSVASIGANWTNLPGPVYNWIFRYNVFANLELGASCSVPYTTWHNNTFYKVNTTQGAALNFGLYDFTYSDPRGAALYSQVLSNAFIGCGKNSGTGWYSVSAIGAWASNPYPTYPYDTVLTNCDWNYVGGIGGSPKDQGTGYPSANPLRFSEPHGINGGSVNLVNPDAGDFRIQTGSVLDLGGGKFIGAYPVTTSGGGGGGSSPSQVSGLRLSGYRHLLQ